MSYLYPFVSGLDRLERDIIVMWGKAVPRAMMLSIKYVCPVLLLVRLKTMSTSSKIPDVFLCVRGCICERICVRPQYDYVT